MATTGCFGLLSEIRNVFSADSLSDSEFEDIQENPKADDSILGDPQPGDNEYNKDENGQSAGANANSSRNIFPFEFTAIDLFGQTVTHETLGEKKLFFVHLWATWCPPCIDEMPDLAALAKQYDDDVGFIAMLADFDSNANGALRIYQEAGMPDTFLTIDANNPQLTDLLEMLDSGYVPTTVIIDSSGAMLGSQLVGALGDGYAAILDGFLAG